MHKCLTGLEVDKPQADDVFDYDDMTHAKVVGKITAPHGLGYLNAFRREKKLPGGVRKAAVVAPYEVVVAGRDQLDALNSQVPAITKIINAELRAMADEGCPNVQLDAPIFGGEVNMGMMTAQQAADLIAPCFEGVKAKKSLHFCNGNLRGRPISHALHCAPWVDILERLDGVVDIAAFEVKYFFQWIERDAFKRHAERACSSPPASSTKAATGSSRSRKSANASPIGRAWSAKNGSGCRRLAGLAVILPATMRCCGPKSRTWSHSLHCAPWVDVLQRLDGVVDIAAFEVKYFFQWIERDAFKNMPKSMQLAAGIVDEGSYWIELVKKIRERIADWARVVGEERLWVSPSCGFGRHPPRDNAVLLAKVENMVEAARTL